jgi:hypothetical protein
MMTGVADLARFLRRFRRVASPPGRPGPGAVPADREARRAHELEAVLAAIDAVDREAREILAAADAEALRVKRESEVTARRLVEEAKDGAAAVRAAASARRRGDVDHLVATARSDGQAQAEEVAQQARARREDVAARLAERVREAYIITETGSR